MKYKCIQKQKRKKLVGLLAQFVRTRASLYALVAILLKKTVKKLPRSAVRLYFNQRSARMLPLICH